MQHSRRLLKLKKQINLLHSDDDGYITIGSKNYQKWSQYHYTLDKLNDDLLLKFLNSKKDMYLSLNSFYVPIRKVENIRKLNCFFIDLDLHGKGFTPHILNSALFFLWGDYFNRVIPEPNLIIFTGRGIQLFFKIKNLPKQLVPLFQVVQNSFNSALESFDYYGLKVDNSCSDVTRLCRMSGTYNSKSKTRARILHINDTEYKINEIIEGYFPHLNIIGNKTRKKYSNNNYKIINNFNTHTLHYYRLMDIIKLQELRKGNCTGHREIMSFLYRYYSLLYTKDSKKALADTLDFNSKFTHPLRQREVIKATYSAQKAFKKRLESNEENEITINRYNYISTTLISILDITEEEQSQLKTIISKKVKYSRNNKKRKASRRNENGLTKRQQNKIDKLTEIKILKAKGLNNTQISKILGISRKHVSNLINKEGKKV